MNPSGGGVIQLQPRGGRQGKILIAARLVQSGAYKEIRNRRGGGYTWMGEFGIFLPVFKKTDKSNDLYMLVFNLITRP